MPSPTGPARLVLCVLVTLALAACAVVPNPLATPVPPDALHPNQPVPVESTPTLAPNPVKVGELDLQRAVWERAGIANYRIQLIYGCQCVLGGQTVDVTVRDGEISSATIDGKLLDPNGLVGFPATVDELFDYAQRNAGAGKVELKYDDILGYPTALGVDPDLEVRDDSIRIVVLELAPGR